MTDSFQQGIVMTTEKFAAAYEVLESDDLIKEMIKNRKMDADKVAAFKKRIQDAWDNLETEKKNEALELIKEIMKDSGLVGADLKPLFPAAPEVPKIDGSSTSQKKRKEVPPKWYRFEHDGIEYFINRSPSGNKPGVLAKYLESENKTLDQLEVDASKVVQSKVITADDLGKLSKKVKESQ